MQVHGVLVGEVDLHEAEGILLPRTLAEIVVVDRLPEPIDLTRVKRIAGLVEGLHVIGGQHVLAAFGEHAALGYEVLVHDAARHVPIGVEVDLADLAGELGCRPVDLADHGGVALHDAAALDGFHLGRRDVDEDVAAGRRGCQALQAFQVRFELREAHGRRNVQRLDRRLRVDDAGRRQTMPQLEAFHRSHDRGVVLIGHAHADEVAADFQPLMQRHDFGATRARLHRHRRHGRPAALRNDALVFLDRGLRRRDVAGRERGRAKRRIDDHGDLGVA